MAERQVDISVVAPVYRGEAFVDELTRRVGSTLSPLTERYEIVLVDDGSTDGTWARIVDAAKRDPRVRGVRLSRNFGQHPAITAGVNHARGDWIAVMDSDLQDRPEDIAGLYRMAMTGDFDMVIGRRSPQRGPLTRRLSSSFFNWTLAGLSDLQTGKRTGNFRIFSRQVADAFALYREQFRFFPALMARLGFRVGFLDVDGEVRSDGKSTYTPLGRLKLATDAIIANSEKPLWLGIIVGSIVAFLAFALALWAALSAILFGVSVSGWTSLFVAIAFFSGVQLSFAGLVGLYVGRVFNETKRRPVYIVADKINLDTAALPKARTRPAPKLASERIA